MSFLFGRKSATSATLILDIGSKSVGGAIYTVTNLGEAKLLYVVREQIAFQKELKGERLLSATITSLSTLLVHIEKYGVEHSMTRGNESYRVERVVFVISSPWHISETKLLSLKLTSPAVITESMTHSLVLSEEKVFSERVGKDSDVGGSFEPLEQKIIEISLNGYPTTKPYGKVAERLDVTMFNSVISSDVLSAFRKTVQKYFPVENFIYHTFSLASYVSLRDHAPKNENFLIVQIGGEVTDITIVKKSLVVETVSFPLGRNGLLRSLSQICGAHPHCTLEAVLALHLDASLENSDKPRVEKAITEIKTRWLQYFNQAISNFSEETFVPRDVFLFEEPPYSGLFEEFLREAGASQFTITAEPFVVRVVDETYVSSLSGRDRSIRIDPVITMEANFSARTDIEEEK